MATDNDFVEHVAEQAGLGPELTFKKMFGEYGVYLGGKVIAFACENSLFLKATDATAALTAALPRRPPYPGAKPYPVADELLDDPDALKALLQATASALPLPKPRKPKQSAAGSATLPPPARPTSSTRPPRKPQQ